MNVNNQTPALLNANYIENITLDPDFSKRLNESIVNPIFTPLTPGTKVDITLNNQPILPEHINDMLIKSCGDKPDPMLDYNLKKVFGKTLIYFNESTNLNIQNLFAIQSGAKEKMTFPAPNIMYTASTDIIPTSREFLAGICSYDKLFATFTFYTQANTLAFYFKTETSFNDFKTWLSQQIQTIATALPQKTTQLFTQFNNIKLNQLTESLLIRNGDSDEQDPLTFARMLTNYLMTYANTIGQTEFGIFPFTLKEFINPKTLIFVNIEEHSKQSQSNIQKEWDLINKSIQGKPKMISVNKLNKLTSAQRMLQKIASQGNMHSLKENASRASKISFRKTQPTPKDLATNIKKIIDKMAFVNRSQNQYKSIKTTFAKPNRRDPDNLNKKGKITSTKYKPDLHLYIDTSGSISENNYIDMIKASIQIAKHLNINLYFNSFSHVLSQTTLLKTHGKSTASIYREFEKVPKVTGGTDYKQIWNFINDSKKRKQELSIIISDLEFYAPNEYIKQPKNLYYVPCANMNYKTIKHYAKTFMLSMKHNDPNIRKKLLF